MKLSISTISLLRSAQKSWQLAKCNNSWHHCSNSFIHHQPFFFYLSNTVVYTQLFSTDLKSPQCLKNKIWGNPYKPHHMGGKKIPLVSPAWSSGRGRGRIQTSKLLQKISKFLILSTGLPWRQSLTEIAARWHCRLPIQNLTPHYNIMWPPHNLVHFKYLLWWGFFNHVNHRYTQSLKIIENLKKSRKRKKCSIDLWFHIFQHSIIQSCHNWLFVSLLDWVLLSTLSTFEHLKY